MEEEEEEEDEHEDEDLICSAKIVTKSLESFLNGAPAFPLPRFAFLFNVERFPSIFLTLFCVGPSNDNKGEDNDGGRIGVIAGGILDVKIAPTFG